jgi:hypothetical protein
MYNRISLAHTHWQQELVAADAVAAAADDAGATNMTSGSHSSTMTT